MIPQLLPDHSLKSLAEVIGPLPAGDIPAAWYCSLHPEVCEAYERWRVAHQGWRDRFAELCEISGFEQSKVKIAAFGEDAITGLYLSEDTTNPWWRQDKRGFWVPRKRTKAEKGSEITARFEACRRVPSVLKYVPGMPHSLWIDGPPDRVYPVKVRKPAQAVLAFLGADPARATTVPFQVSEHWSQMKLSTFHMLRERVAAAGG